MFEEEEPRGAAILSLYVRVYAALVLYLTVSRFWRVLVQSNTELFEAGAS